MRGTLVIVIFPIKKLISSLIRLNGTRRKRAVPDGWATGRDLQTFAPTVKSESLYPMAKSLVANASHDTLLTGGDNGIAGIYDVSTNEIVQELDVGSGTVTDAAWAGARAIVSTSSGVVKVFEDGLQTSTFSGHAGKIAALAMHPSGDILASAGIDKSYILYDLKNSTQATQVYTDSGK